jgi:hypothetical protein
VRRNPQPTKHYSAFPLLTAPGILRIESHAKSEELKINSPPQVGQWYTRLETKETFLVTGYDDKSCTIETQASNGDLDEIDAENWSGLPLAFAEPPEDWTEVLDDVEVAGANALVAPIERFLSL